MSRTRILSGRTYLLLPSSLSLPLLLSNFSLGLSLAQYKRTYLMLGAQPLGTISQTSVVLFLIEVGVLKCLLWLSLNLQLTSFPFQAFNLSAKLSSFLTTTWGLLSCCDCGNGAWWAMPVFATTPLPNIWDISGSCFLRDGCVIFFKYTSVPEQFEFQCLYSWWLRICAVCYQIDAAEYNVNVHYEKNYAWI